MGMREHRVVLAYADYQDVRHQYNLAHLTSPNLYYHIKYQYEGIESGLVVADHVYVFSGYMIARTNSLPTALCAEPILYPFDRCRAARDMLHSTFTGRKYHTHSR